jgi:hypothetical protein
MLSTDGNSQKRLVVRVEHCMSTLLLFLHRHCYGYTHWISLFFLSSNGYQTCKNNTGNIGTQSVSHYSFLTVPLMCEYISTNNFNTCSSATL